MNVKVDMVYILRVVLGIHVCTGNLVITIGIVLITLKGHIYYITVYLLTILLEWIYKLLIITFGYFFLLYSTWKYIMYNMCQVDKETGNVLDNIY